MQHRFQKFPRLRLAVARHLHPDPLMQKPIHVLNQRGDLAQDEERTGVRDWAKAQGIEVKDRGRVPADLAARFKAATGK